MTAALNTRRAVLTALALSALLFAFAVAGIRGAGTGTAGAASCANARAGVGSLSKKEIRRAVACLLNQERVKTHRKAVTYNNKLQKAANYHSHEMQRMHSFTHNSANGQSATNRMHSRFGYGKGARAWGVGEILGECYGRGCTPKALVHRWLKSSIHAKIIHDHRWIHFGVGARHGTAENPGRKSAALLTVDWGFRKG